MNTESLLIQAVTTAKGRGRKHVDVVFLYPCADGTDENETYIPRPGRVPVRVEEYDELRYLLDTYPRVITARDGSSCEATFPVEDTLAVVRRRRGYESAPVRGDLDQDLAAAG